MSIYEWPKEGKAYVLGIDVAEGLEIGDYSSIHVLERESFRVVATWHGHIDPDLLGYEAVGLAKFYNYAVIGCEINNHGFTTINRIKELEYPAIYKRQRLNKLSNATINELGWKTNKQTKPIMIDELVEAVREQSIDISERATIEEMLAFVKDEKGEMGAPQGMYDDRVISLAIAVQMRKLTTAIIAPNMKGKYPTGTWGSAIKHYQKLKTKGFTTRNG